MCDPPTFNDIFQEISKRGRQAGRGPISPALQPLLRRLYDAFVSHPRSVTANYSAILDILRYLTTQEGRTDANCWAVDLFVAEDWTNDWWPTHSDDLPDELNDILADIAIALHDTVAFPDVAEDAGSTPEQLLQQAESLRLLVSE